MNKNCLILSFFVFLLLFSACKKDSSKTVKPAQTVSLNKNLLTFSINGQLIGATIDTIHHKIQAVVPRTFDMHQLTANFTLSPGTNAKINNTTVTTGSVFDFSQPVNFTLLSSDSKNSLNFQVFVNTDLQYFGVLGQVVTENSLDRNYNFYFDQFDGSQYQAINCGPTVSTMALKWADSTFAKTPADARVRIPESGGWWYTNDIQYYLGQYGVNTAVDTLDNVAAVVKKSIDNGNLVILCLDMFGVPKNSLDYEHVQKFYETQSSGWGHFLLVKGYKQTSTNFYLEIYDPYSEHSIYNVITTGQLKGRDRYYVDFSIQFATSKWWPYAMIVAPKGQTVTSSRIKLNSLHKPVPVAWGR